MVNTLDIHIELSNFLPGGEGGAYGAYVILNAPSSLFNDYRAASNPGLELWNREGLADKLASYPVQREITLLNEILGYLRGDVCVEEREEAHPGRTRLMVYEDVKHC